MIEGVYQNHQKRAQKVTSLVFCAVGQLYLTRQKRGHKATSCPAAFEAVGVFVWQNQTDSHHLTAGVFDLEHQTGARKSTSWAAVGAVALFEAVGVFV